MNASWKLAPALAGLLLSACLPWASRAAENWPQFKGEGASGVSDSENLPISWSATENIAWKTEIPGVGWSSPIVWSDRVFLTTVVEKGDATPPKKGLYFGGERLTPPTTEHEWKVLCLSLSTGEILWDRTVHQGTPSWACHIKNSYASETPVTDGERVYSYFGNLGVFCHDFAGNEVWSRKFEAQPTRLGWGTAASPALFENRLFIVNDNEEASFLVALDSKTGEEQWRQPREEKTNWATPFVWRNSLRTEIVAPGTGKVRSYDLDGNLLYEFGGMSVITIPTPSSISDLLFVSSGYVMDKQRPIFAVRPGASGDISLKGDQNSNEYIAWRQSEAGPYNPSPLIYENKIFVLLDLGFMACYDAQTGNEIYGKTRIPGGQRFTASPWAYGGHVFCLNEDGKTFVIEPGSKFELNRTNELTDDDMCLATPAIAGDRLLIRASGRLYCVRNASRE